MEQYLKLLDNILTNGTRRPSGRPGMPDTISLFGTMMKFDLSKGFPLITTKKMFTKGIFHELIWFLNGDTNIKYLVDNGVNIWNGDAYRWYKRKCEELEVEATDEDGYIQNIKNLPDFAGYFGNLGRVYGAQWREFVGINNFTVDQIKDAIDTLKTNPESRRIVITAWNPAEVKNVALPPCHMMFHLNVRPKEIVPGYYLDCNMYQRSCDSFLGTPFNIASYAALTSIIAKYVSMEPGVFTWMGGDTHIYENHIEQVKLQLSREPKKRPRLIISDNIMNTEYLKGLKIKDFEIKDYEYHPTIKGELSTGI